MLPFLKLATLVGLVHFSRAVPQAASTPATTGVPTVTISTSVASPTVPLSALVPSQVALPPVQPWCIGQIFCPGAVSLSWLLLSGTLVDRYS